MEFIQLDNKSSGKGKIQLVCGQVKALIEDVNKYVETPEEIEMEQALYLEGEYIVKLKFNSFCLIYSSISAAYDLFYFEKDGKTVIETDFYKIISLYEGDLTLDAPACDYFVKKGYFKPGDTFYNEIKRVPIGVGVVQYNDGKTYMVRLQKKDWKISEKDYQMGLIKSIEIYNPCEKDYLLFSGGKDSALLAILMKKEFGINLNLVMAQVEKCDWDEDYEKRIDYYREFLDANTKILKLDYDKYSVEKIEYLIRKMPLCTHSAATFDLMNTYVQERGGRSWTGQNSDAMYALGKTGEKFGPMFARYLISDYGLKMLKDVEGVSFGLLAKLLAKLYSAKWNKSYRCANNLSELRKSLLEAPTGMPLVPKEENGYCSLQKYSIKEARNILYEDKMSSYMCGGDSRVVRYAGNIESDTVFPYSSVLMCHIQRNMSMKMNAVIKNKPFISDFIISYIGKKDYDKLYPSEFFNFDRREDRYYHDILNITNYGKDLREYSQYNGTSFQEALSYAWLKIVREDVEKV